MIRVPYLKRPYDSVKIDQNIIEITRTIQKKNLIKNHFSKMNKCNIMLRMKT
jgi:hypothetical protein